MNNYEYITACLPVLASDASTPVKSEEIVDDIRSQCSSKDLKAVDFLLSAYEDGTLCEGFYREAVSGRNAFLREWFSFDLNVRNMRTRWLNKSLGRPENMDCISLGEDMPDDWDEKGKVMEVLSLKDILERERGLDSVYWDKVSDMTVMDIFNLNVILAFLVKMKIVERWQKLDPETGHKLFRKLVEEIRNTKK